MKNPSAREQKKETMHQGRLFLPSTVAEFTIETGTDVGEHAVVQSHEVSLGGGGCLRG